MSTRAIGIGTVGLHDISAPVSRSSGEGQLGDALGPSTVCPPSALCPRATNPLSVVFTTQPSPYTTMEFSEIPDNTPLVSDAASPIWAWWRGCSRRFGGSRI